MSLVNEALRKVQHEAGATAPQAVPAYAAHRGRRGVSTTLVVLTGFMMLCAVAAGAGAYVVIARAAEPSHVVALDPTPTAAPIDMVIEPAKAAPELKPVEQTPPQSVAIVREETIPATETGPVEPEPAPAPPAATAVDSAPEATGATELVELKPIEPRDPVNGQEFVQSVNVPGLPRVTLSGIIFSDIAQVALLGGATVRAGETIQGYRIDAIERNRVTLSINGKTIYLRLP